MKNEIDENLNKRIKVDRSNKLLFQEYPQHQKQSYPACVSQPTNETLANNQFIHTKKVNG